MGDSGGPLTIRIGIKLIQLTRIGRLDRDLPLYANAGKLIQNFFRQFSFTGDESDHITRKRDTCSWKGQLERTRTWKV